jgi:hypothetical protein
MGNYGVDSVLAVAVGLMAEQGGGISHEVALDGY